jgi:TRAP-type mannitol/chloroaromatic compound transport system permease small subunit
VNKAVGLFAMYGIFAAMAGLLLFSSISRSVFDVSYIWAVEMSMFIMAAYYLLGGGYSMMMDSHVRMDLWYSKWSPRTRAIVDAITSVFLVFYLVYLLLGAIASTEYALVHDQKNYTAWSPPLAPIKIVMAVGIALMLLQVVATFFRDLAKAINRPMP